MNIYRLIDENALFVEDVINPQIKEGQEQFFIEAPVPQGFYHPKWNGTEWVEGLTQAQIDELKNQPLEPTPEQQEMRALKKRLDEAENTVLFLIDMQMMGGM